MPTVKLKVRVTPRASRDQICSWSDGRLAVRVTAPPVDGAANEATVKVLAGALKIPAADMAVISGHSSRSKVLAISGHDMEQLRRRLREALKR